MSKAYIAYAEQAVLVCAYSKDAAKALKKIAKKVDEMQTINENVMLLGVNVSYDDEGFYNVTATVSTVGV